MTQLGLLNSQCWKVNWIFLEVETPGFDLFNNISFEFLTATSEENFLGIFNFVWGTLPSESFSINNSRVFSSRQNELFIGMAGDYCGCHPSDVTETNHLLFQMSQIFKTLVEKRIQETLINLLCLTSVSSRTYKSFHSRVWAVFCTRSEIVSDWRSEIL